MILYFIYIAALLAAFIVIIHSGSELLLSEQREREERILCTRYAQLTVRYSLPAAATNTAPTFPRLHNRRRRLLLARVLAKLSGRLCADSSTPIAAIVYRYALSREVLHLAMHSGNMRRTEHLELLAHLPLDDETRATVSEIVPRNRAERFCLLIASIAADTTTAMQHIAGFDLPMNYAEIARLHMLLRRGGVPIAVEPMLASDAYNLNFLGITLVAQYEITQAEPLLYRIIESDKPMRLRTEAVYALAAANLPLSRPTVLEHLQHQSHSDRRALCRYLAAGGYSTRAVTAIFEQSERDYYAAILSSYKTTLVC